MSINEKLAPNTPVIIGVGCYQDHRDDPSESAEAYLLMANAIRSASDDAGCPELLSQIDSIAIPKGTWHYNNPARLIADNIGAIRAKSIYANIGIMQLTLMSNACKAIIAGEQHIAVVTGGDAKYRALRSQITGIEVADTDDSESEPDVSLSSDDPLWADLEGERGLMMPTEFYAIMESSMRKAQGLGIDEHRDVISQMYSEFSEVAAKNPHAWKQEVVSKDDIRNPVGKNAMLSFPYTKKHNTQWNVNQASAIIICSVKKARELGIAEEKFVFPLAATQSTDVIPMSQRQVIHSSFGTKAAAKKLFELGRINKDDIDHLELYSCFPASVRSFAFDSGIGLDRQLTITGGMPFAGGPLNNFTLQGVVRMVEILREDPGSKGLISNLSSIINKQAFILLSTDPSDTGYAFADVSDEVAAVNIPIDLVKDYEGDVTIVGYTVVYNKEGISHGIAVCNLPDGKRTVGQCFDKDLLQMMTEQEYCGETVVIGLDGQFKVA